MHLITGVIIAALAGKAKQNRALQGLPMLQTGPLKVAHAIPGRIRFVVPRLKEHDERMVDGIAQLKDVKAIDTVSYSVVTGSIVIHYDQSRIDPPLLFAVLARLLGLELELEKPVDSKIVKEIRELAGSLNRMVHNETRGILDLQTIIIGTLLFFGGKKLLLDRWAAVPGGLTLVWWAMNLINREKG